MSTITKRNGSTPVDQHSIESYTYSESAGSRKVSEVGRSLKPIPTGTGFTTNVATATALPTFGMNFAIYNNSATLASVNFGTSSSILSLAPGATDANGGVGIALPPNAWTYVAAGSNNFIISSAATVLVYLIEDASFITVVTTKAK